MDTNNRSNMFALCDIGVRNDIIKAFKVKHFCRFRLSHFNMLSN